MDNSDLAIPYLDADVDVGGSSSNSKWLIGGIVLLVVAVVVYLLMKPKTNNNSKAVKSTPPPAVAATPPPPPPPPRVSYLPTSPEARMLPVNAPEPTPFDVYSGREQTFAEYLPGPQYELAFRQPANEVKVALIDCQSSDMFQEIVVNNKKEVVCAFTSKGCGHCQQMKPEYEKAAGQAPIPFMIIEQSAAGDNLLKNYGIKGFPTILRFRDGLPVATFNGPRTAENFIRFAS
jgi:thiol-disulfide isomerase/thioredoxin